jgi:hypothetical protein
VVDSHLQTGTVVYFAALPRRAEPPSYASSYELVRIRQTPRRCSGDYAAFSHQTYNADNYPRFGGNEDDQIKKTALLILS